MKRILLAVFAVVLLAGCGVSKVQMSAPTTQPHNYSAAQKYGLHPQHSQRFGGAPGVCNSPVYTGSNANDTYNTDAGGYYWVNNDAWNGSAGTPSTTSALATLLRPRPSLGTRLAT